MADPKLCCVDDCGKLAPHGRYCSMHAARLKRGGSLDHRVPRRSLEQLLDGRSQFGDWAILSEGVPYQRPLVDGNRNPNGQQRTAVCRCSCGEVRTIPVQILKSGQSRHCGCKVSAIVTELKTIHGMSHTSEYRSWSHMKERCSNPNCEDWPDYGGRGIRVHPEWMGSFEPFFDHLGPKPDASFSIDRIDVNGHYEPGNVRWADKWTQARNKRRR